MSSKIIFIVPCVPKPQINQHRDAENLYILCQSKSEYGQFIFSEMILTNEI